MGPSRRVSLNVLFPSVLALMGLVSACGSQNRPEPSAKDHVLALDSIPPEIEPSSLPSSKWRKVESSQILLGQSSVALDNGKILFSGGLGGSSSVNAIHLYDPATDTWEVGPPMPVARHDHASVQLRDGRVLVFGGYTQSGFTDSQPLMTSAFFDPNIHAWADGPDMEEFLLMPSTILLGDGRVLAFGGLGSETTLQIYDPGVIGIGHWELGPNIPMDLNPGFTGTRFPDDSVWFAGSGSSEIFVFNDGWDSLPFGWLTARSEHTATLLADGRVLFVGGQNTDFEYTRDVEIHHANGSAEPSYAAEFPDGRTSHTAALLPNGHVIIVGGFDGANALKSTEIYDPEQDLWTPGPELNGPRRAHTMVATAHHLVVIGGSSGQQAATSLEVLGPSPVGEPAELGATCSEDDECASRYCRDGVCCESACEGACFACSAELKGGGDDGFCGPTAAGSNPREMCSDEGAASCGTTGLCDGDGACAVYEEGTICGEGLVCAAGVCGAGPVEFCADQPNGTPCGDDEACTVSLCQNAACVKTHKLDGALCEGGICMAGECKADKAAPFTGDSTGGNDGLAGGDASDPADQSGNSSPEDGSDEGGGLCSAAPGASGSLPMGFALALLAGIGAYRRRGGDLH